MPEDTSSTGGLEDAIASVDGDVTFRRATLGDQGDVTAFTQETWSDREGGDYIHRIYPDWIEGDDPDARERQFTCVAEVDGSVVSIAQVVLLSAHEAWCQGMRTDPAYRGQRIGEAVTYELWDWARDRGASVARNMVFSWNMAGLGHSRLVGFEPVTEFRWMHPEPDADAELTPPTAPSGDRSARTTAQSCNRALDVTSDVHAAWAYWTASDARTHLKGLGLDADESWAMRELTRASFADAATDGFLGVVQRDDGTCGVTYRVRDYERESDAGEIETFAEYGVAAWDDVQALRALVGAIKRDAAALDADHTRVLIPETPRHVSDASLVRAGISDDPDFVLAADLTRNYRPSQTDDD